MADIDRVALASHALLRARTADLIAQTSGWCVGLSDRPHFERRHGRVRPTGTTLGGRAAMDLPLGGEEDALLELGDAEPGTLRDALNALTPEGTVYAEALERDVLAPFAVRVCIDVLKRARAGDPDVWADLLDGADGESDDDLAELVRMGEWADPLVEEAEQLVLSALGEARLLDVEAEGLRHAVVAAAEEHTRAAQAQMADSVELLPDPDDLAGALFLAESAVRASGLPLPVAPDDAETLLEVLADVGVEPDEIVRLLPVLPVMQDTVELTETIIEAREIMR